MIKVLDYTKEPLTLMGKCASICYDSKNSVAIAKDCIESGHTRVAEFGDVTVEISGYSARVIRELYTHHIGVTRLQSSTRYIDYNNFKYYTPPSIKSNTMANYYYGQLMNNIIATYKALEDLGISKQDMANILPLAMESTMVLKINIRALMHMSEVRLCNRALLEYRNLMKELLGVIGSLNDEWGQIVEYCKPKCLVMGYCNESQSCGMMPKREDIIK